MGYAVDKAYQEATGEVDYQGAYGESPVQYFLRQLLQPVARYASNKAAGTDKKDGLHNKELFLRKYKKKPVPVKRKRCGPGCGCYTA